MSSSIPPKSPLSVILAAVDASAICETVIDRAVLLARSLPDAELHILHVVDSNALAAVAVGPTPLAVPSAAQLLKAGREHLERMLARAESLGATPTGHLSTGVPTREILQLASSLSSDLLIVGTHDPGKIERWLLGSIAEDVLRKAHCPVFVVRAKSEEIAVPEIVPPCPDCVAKQRATKGKEMWCDRHSQHHPRAHGWHEYPGGFGEGAQKFQE